MPRFVLPLFTVALVYCTFSLSLYQMVTKFQFIWPSSFRGEDFKKSANQKQELPVAAMYVNRLEQNEQSLERTKFGRKHLW
jgi:hypothetical protein